MYAMSRSVLSRDACVFICVCDEALMTRHSSSKKQRLKTCENIRVQSIPEYCLLHCRKIKVGTPPPVLVFTVSN